jgi:hypothetical protein
LFELFLLLIAAYAAANTPPAIKLNGGGKVEVALNPFKIDSAVVTNV